MSRCGSIGWSFGPSWLEVCRGTEVRGVRRARGPLRGTGLDADADDPQAAVEQDPAVVGTVQPRLDDRVGRGQRAAAPAEVLREPPAVPAAEPAGAGDAVAQVRAAG